MSKFGAKTYSRRQECRSKVQFDQLLSDNKNKPSTAKVSAGVQRWGVATFTSLRKTQLNGQKEHDVEEESKRFKMDISMEKGRTKSVIDDDPFSFDLDKDTSPVKVLTPPVKKPTVSCKVEKKTEASSYSKPNKFFKSSARRLGAQLNPTVVLEKTFSYDKIQSQPMDYIQQSENLTTQPTVVKILSPTKAKVEDRTDRSAAKPSAFDLLFVQDNSTAKEIDVNKKSFSCKTDDWFDCFDNCKDSARTNLDVQVVSKFSVGESSPDVEIISERTEGDKFCYSINASSSNPSMASSSIPVARTYSQRKTQENTFEKSIKLSVSPVKEVISSLKHSDQMQWLNPLPAPALDVQDAKDIQDDSTTPNSSQETPCSSQEILSSEKPDINKHVRGQKSRKSIFKSRNVVNSPNKKKFLYKHRPWQDDDKEEMEFEKDTTKPSLSEEFEDEIQEKPDLTLSKRVTQKISYSSRETITSWKCDKKAKELYTVVHNVKQAYQCHESGETQEFNDEVEYLLEGIQPTSSLGTRCLSTVGWATKCMLPSFRIHLRADGTIPRVFSALMDAPKDPSLSLSTATLMFVLSQDRLTMDLEANTLSLMLQLLEASPGDGMESSFESQSEAENASETISFQQASKMKEKVRQLCEEMQQKGYAKQLNLENITTGNLAMETLLSLTSRKAGEWFKEGIRNLGGLDYIVNAVDICIQRCCLQLQVIGQLAEPDLSELKKIDRCLRVLENVTYMNADNQAYLLKYKNAVIVSSCFNLLEYCGSSIVHNPIPLEGCEKSASKTSNLPSTVLSACILSSLKVLLNLTHETASGSLAVGSHEGMLECILLCVLQVPQFLPPEERFDLLVLALGLLINLMEHCEENRHRIAFVHTVGSFDSPNTGEELSALEALVEVFLGRVDAARQSEEQADALLDAKDKTKDNSKKSEEDINSTPSSSQQSQAEELEETLMKALQKAGKNMEHSIIAAYIALLLGCIIQNKDYADLVRDHMPNGNFNAMVEILRKFLNFVSLTGVVGTTGLNSIQKVLRVLESS